MSSLSSQRQSASIRSAASPEKKQSSFSANQQTNLFNGPVGAVPGTQNDAAMVRAVITEAMKNCGLSRVQIADEMSRLTGTIVTERQLNNFSADSREEYRFPSELERAFCSATGDCRLITYKAELAGLHVITDKERDLLELGRKYLLRQRSEAAIADLEHRLQGVDL